MGTLLMRLAAPMQSWGVESKFDVRRDTGREPSKSGVIGLVAAALGVRRQEEEKLARLAGMRFGVRVDREGVLTRDYHTASNERATCVTHRYYLADAEFVVGLESDDEEMLQEIACALKHPAYPLYLGRRSCPPMGRLFLGISGDGLEHALREAACTSGSGADKRLVLEAGAGEGGRLVKDVPFSFNPEHRRYAFRRVVERCAASNEHDPFAELEE